MTQYGKAQAQEALLTQKQMNKFTTAMIKPYNYQSNIIFSGTGTTTGTNQLEYDREYEVRKTAKQHTNKKYFYVISVNDTDDVFYQVYHGGKIAFWVYKLVGSSLNYWKKPIGSSWKGIRKRTHLPATVGAIYLAIDKDIEAHVELLGHDEYVAGLLKTEPENLKMIEGLEKLQEGEPDPQGISCQEPSKYSHSVNTSGNVSFAAGGSNSFYIPVTTTVTLEDKIDEAVQAKTDEFMTDMLDAKKKVAGKASQ